jgi:hypothetical protein
MPLVMRLSIIIITLMGLEITSCHAPLVNNSPCDDDDGGHVVVVCRLPITASPGATEKTRTARNPA